MYTSFMQKLRQHASLWSPEVKATNVKPATSDYLRAGDFWSAMIATLYLSVF